MILCAHLITMIVMLAFKYFAIVILWEYLLITVNWMLLQLSKEPILLGCVISGAYP